MGSGRTSGRRVAEGGGYVIGTVERGKRVLKSRCIPITSTGREVSISVGPGSHYYID